MKKNDIDKLILDNIRLLSEQKEIKLITDKKVFSSNYQPSNILYRDDEIETLIERFISTRFGEYCPDLSIYGVTGTGKTLITKQIFNSLSKGTDATHYIFIPCNEYSTPVAILKFISSQLNLKDKGRGTSDFYQHIKNGIKDKLLVLIFDEIDVFIEKDELHQNLIQVFSDWNNCVLVFISNNPGWHELITDHRTISRLHLSNLIIKPYGSDEILGILQDRASKGLKPGAINNTALSKIADFTSQYSGDARVAIKILSNAASAADKRNYDEINHNLIDIAIDSIEEDNLFYFIERLSPQLKLILISVYQASRNFANPDLNSIYDEYEILIVDSKMWRKLSKNTIQIYLNELVTYQLIEKNTGKGRGRGKGRESTKINLTFDKEKFKEIIISKMIKKPSRR